MDAYTIGIRKKDTGLAVLEHGQYSCAIDALSAIQPDLISDECDDVVLLNDNDEQLELIFKDGNAAIALVDDVLYSLSDAIASLPPISMDEAGHLLEALKRVAGFCPSLGLQMPLAVIESMIATASRDEYMTDEQVELVLSGIKNSPSYSLEQQESGGLSAPGPG